MDKETEIKKYNNLLRNLLILTVIFAIITIASFVLIFLGKGDPIVSILCLATTLMFFFAHREKSSAPRPGSPEYEAIERARKAKVKASREQAYKKQHPFEVARDLVESNKSSSSKSSKNPPKKDTVH